MATFGTVKVKNGKYKINGDFHVAAPCMPIRNEDEGWRLMGVTNPRNITHIHMYGGEAIFFEGLGQGKLHGSKCDNPDCEFPGTVFLPFRIHCPDCLAKNTVVDLTETAQKTARIHTFMVCERSGAFNALPTPIRFINVEFDGVSTILMGYLSVGEPKIGMRVVPIFKKTNPTYTIMDLSWVAEGTPESELPQDFSY
jgi:uncharacterized OB-fold protein